MPFAPCYPPGRIYVAGVRHDANIVRRRSTLLAVRTAIAALLAVSMAFVAACSTQSDAGFEYLRVTVGGESVLGISKKGLQIRGLVIFFQGPEQDEFVLTADAPHTSMTNALTNAGFAVIAGHGSANIFQSSDAVRNYGEIAGMATAQFRTHNIYFLAESLGALSAVRLLALSRTSQVRGLAAINPALDLDAAPPELRGEFESSDPTESIDSLNPLGFPLDSMQGKMLRFYVTPTDAVIATGANALAFQRRFGPVADISIVQCTGVHLDPSCIQGDDIVKWFAKLEYRAEP
jgi:hypothetical protein